MFTEQHHPLAREFTRYVRIIFIGISFGLLIASTCAVRASDGSTHVSDEQVIAGFGSWQEPSGILAFEAICNRLATTPSSQNSCPPLHEGGPRNREPAGEIPQLHLDMSTSFLFSSRWHPGQAPFDLLEPYPLNDGKDHFRWRHETGLWVQLPGGWALQEQVIIDSDSQQDPTHRMREYEQIDASFEVPVACVQYQTGPLRCHFGRRWRQWGPGWTGSLILGAVRAPGTGFDAAYTRQRWSASFFYERINDELAGDVATTVPLARYLSGHRLDFSLGANLRIGLTETAVTASRGAPPFWALNPVFPWSLGQQERESNDYSANVLWSLDAIWNPRPGWVLYGQFLLDDYMIDTEDRDRYPDQLGWLGGILWHSDDTAMIAGTSSSGARWSAGLEYCRLSNWVYIHREFSTRYQAWQAPLGHPQGPDSESINGFFQLNLKERQVRLALFARHLRFGRINLATTENSTGQADLPFPAPPVSHQTHLVIHLDCPGPLSSAIRGQLGWLDKVTAGETTWYSALSVSLPILNWLTSL